MSPHRCPSLLLIWIIKQLALPAISFLVLFGSTLGLERILLEGISQVGPCSKGIHWASPQRDSETEMVSVERLWVGPSILSVCPAQIQNKTGLVGDLPLIHRRHSLLL